MKKSTPTRQLVRDFLLAEKRLGLLAIKLRMLDGTDARNSYFALSIRTPEQAAELIWGYVANGSEPLDYYDRAVMQMPVDTRKFEAAELIAQYAEKQGWTEKLQSLLAKDVKSAVYLDSEPIAYA
jgi:hypothetical protein